MDSCLNICSSSQSLKKTDVQFLEYLALELVKKTKTFSIKDNKKYLKNHIYLKMKEISSKFFEEIKFLCSFLHYSLFNEVKKEINLFYCENSRGAESQAIYSADGMTILEDPKIAKDMAPSYSNAGVREGMIQESARAKNKYFELTKNIEFTSPSTASSFCLGRNSNGRIDWKDKQGKTLDYVFRKKSN